MLGVEKVESWPGVVFVCVCLGGEGGGELLILHVHTHTHTQIQLPYTSLAHAQQGIIIRCNCFIAYFHSGIMYNGWVYPT